MLDPVLMIAFMLLSALKFSTLTRGGGGWRPFLHLHVKWMSSSFVAFLSVKTINCFFEILNYFPQKRTLWRGQSLSSPIRRRFSDPPNAANRWMQQCARFLWCFMLFSTLKPGGWGSPDRSAAVWYRCTGSFCFNPSGPSQYMTLNSTWLLFKVRTCIWCMRTSPNAHIYIHVRICTLKYA